MPSHLESIIFMMHIGRNVGLAAAFTEIALHWTPWFRWLPLIIVSTVWAWLELGLLLTFGEYLERVVRRQDLLKLVESVAPATLILQFLTAAFAGLFAITLCSRPWFQATIAVKCLTFLGSMAFGAVAGVFLAVLYIVVRYLLWVLLDHLKYQRKNR